MCQLHSHHTPCSLPHYTQHSSLSLVITRSSCHVIGGVSLDTLLRALECIHSVLLSSRALLIVVRTWKIRRPVMFIYGLWNVCVFSQAYLLDMSCELLMKPTGFSQFTLVLFLWSLIWSPLSLLPCLRVGLKLMPFSNSFCITDGKQLNSVAHHISITFSIDFL